MNETTVTTPNELETRVERIFDAPRAHVLSVWTDPQLIPEWWGDGTVVEEMDVRPGILIVSRNHLERVLAEYVAHHNTHRPHRALGQRPPIPKPIPIPTPPSDAHVRRRDRLGGLLHEYELAAYLFPLTATACRKERFARTGGCKPSAARTICRNEDLKRRSNKRQRCLDWQLDQPRSHRIRRG